jgi:hypothetical protein
MRGIRVSSWAGGEFRGGIYMSCRVLKREYPEDGWFFRLLGSLYPENFLCRYQASKSFVQTSLKTKMMIIAPILLAAIGYVLFPPFFCDSYPPSSAAASCSWRSTTRPCGHWKKSSSRRGHETGHDVCVTDCTNPPCQLQFSIPYCTVSKTTVS